MLLSHAGLIYKENCRLFQMQLHLEFVKPREKKEEDFQKCRWAWGTVKIKRLVKAEAKMGQNQVTEIQGMLMKF